MDKDINLKDSNKTIKATPRGNSNPGKTIWASACIYMQAETLKFILEQKFDGVLANAVKLGSNIASNVNNILPDAEHIDKSQITISYDSNIAKSYIEIFAGIHVSGAMDGRTIAITAVTMTCLSIFSACQDMDTTLNISNIHINYRDKIENNRVFS